MKKQLGLLMAGMLTVCITHAQIKKGDILLGGNVGFTSSRINYAGGDLPTKQTQYSLLPSIGRAVRDDLVVGLNLGYAHNKTKSGGSPAGIQSSDSYGLGVFVRKYKVLGAGFAFFGEGDLNGQYIFSRSYTEGYPKGPGSKDYTGGLGFYPGIAYFVSRHVQVEMGIQNLVYVQYGHQKSGESPDELKNDTFSAGTNLNQVLDNFIVGVKWVL